MQIKHADAGCNQTVETTKMKREDAMKLVDQGIAALNAALQAGHSEALKQFLATLARFHHYSFGNALLIAFQKPEATHVAGFHTWRKLGRYVKKGEHGIAILAPMVGRKDRVTVAPEPTDDQTRSLRGFKVAYVFDVTQTDGQALPQFAQPVGEPGEWLRHMEDFIQAAGITLEDDFLPGGADGGSRPGQIIVRPDLPSNERFAVLAHEFAHELLHQRTQRRKETTPKIRETEAEAVAYAVCLACGIDSTMRSADYIQLYRGSEETLKESLTHVQQAATEIITGLQTRQECHSQNIGAALAV
jgi:antirestriction protein ArdC